MLRSCLLLLSTTMAAYAVESSFRYRVDLTERADDRFHVVLELPHLPNGPAIFQMPATVPGTYQIQDWGQAVEDLVAEDVDGAPLAVEARPPNQWVVTDGGRLARLRYAVDDSLDGDVIHTWGMADTDLDAGHATIQPYALFGYIHGQREVEFTTTYILPDGWRLACALPHTTDRGEVLMAATGYDALADAPVLAGALDLESFNIAGCTVDIAVSSPLGDLSPLTAAIIRREVEPVLVATADFLGGLPADRYAFLFRGADRHLDECGALEHNTSSFYYMPDITPASELSHIAAHEFFHIVTPLNLRSPIIAHFDFTTPTSSRHLWFYEGATEYASHLIRVRAGLTTESGFFTILRDKFATADRFRWDLPMTELSLGCYTEHNDQYINVYNKGALLALALDLRLRMSAADQGLRELFASLLATFNADHPFPEEGFFTVIAEHSTPDIGPFLQRFIGGGETPPFADLFAAAGYRYDPVGTPWVDPRWPTLFSPDGVCLAVWGRSPDPIPRGFRFGDRVLAIDGQAVGPADLDHLADRARSLQMGDAVTFTVERAGLREQVVTTARSGRATQHRLTSFPVLSTAQVELRRAWLGRAVSGWP